MSEKIEIVIVDESTGESQPSPSPPSTVPPPRPASSDTTPPTPQTEPAQPTNQPAQPTTPPQPSQPQTSSSDSWLDRFGRILDRTLGMRIGRPIRRMEMAFRRVLQLPLQAVQQVGRVAQGLGGQIIDRVLPRRPDVRMDGGGDGKSHRVYKLTAIAQRRRMIRLLHQIATLGGRRDNVIEGIFRRSGTPRLANRQPRIGQQTAGTAVATRGATTPAATGGAARVGAAGASRLAGMAGRAGAALASNPIGWAIAIITAAVAATALALYGLAKVFKHNERELASVSPQISAALAEREFGRVQQRIERNERIGEQTAAMTRTWTRFEEAQFELWTAIYELLVPFAPALEMVIDFLTAIVQSLKATIRLLMVIVQVLDAIYDIMNGPLFGDLIDGGVVDAIQDYQNAMKDATDAWLEVLTTNSGKGQSNTNNFGRNPFKNQSAPPTPNLFNPGLPRGKGRII